MPLADAQPKPNPVIEWMRAQVARIPESEVPEPRFFMDPRSFSILNMARAGANSALNWLDATNRALQGYDPRGALEQGDVLAPLGLSAMAAPFAVRGAIGSAGGRLSAAASGLPMDEASRLARAREMGFDVDSPIYHNSRSENLTEFRPVSESVNDMGLLGPVETTRHGVFFSDNPEFAAEYGPHPGTYVTRANNPADIDRVRQQFVDSLDPFGPDRDLWLAAKFGAREPWQLFEGELGKRFTQWLKDEGYDSAKFYEETPTRAGDYVGGNTTVVFDPRHIRRIEAAFDPSKSDSANLFAADTAISSLPGTVVNADQDRRRIFLIPLGAPQF